MTLVRSAKRRSSECIGVADSQALYVTGLRHRRQVGHRVIDLATLVHGTKSPSRFNAGG